MSDSLPKLHHVVFCVERANQDQAAAFWKDLGFTFVDIALAEEGLRVLLDWDGGIEIISPTDAGGSEVADIERFLRERGEGVYSVVVRTADIEGPISVAQRHGALVEYQQHRGSPAPGNELDEARLGPVHGMPVTFLATDRA